MWVNGCVAEVDPSGPDFFDRTFPGTLKRRFRAELAPGRSSINPSFLSWSSKRLLEIIRPCWSKAYVSPDLPDRATDRIRVNSASGSMMSASAPRTTPLLSRTGAATCISVTSPRRKRANSGGDGRPRFGKSFVPFSRGGSGSSDDLRDSSFRGRRDRGPPTAGRLGLNGVMMTGCPEANSSENLARCSS